MPITLEDLELFSAERNHDTKSFDCGDADLNDFVHTDCHDYRDQWLSHTLLAQYKANEVIVGFVTLLSDSIVLETSEKKHLFSFHKHVYHFPALKIGRLGVQKEFQKQGVGKALLEYSIGVAYRMNTGLSVGCRFITVDAYPASVPWYEHCGFVFNQLENKKEKRNRSMRYDLLRSTPLR